MSQLSAKVRAKYPGAYDDLSDADLEAKVLAKYPEYKDLAEAPSPPGELSDNERYAQTLHTDAQGNTLSFPHMAVPHGPEAAARQLRELITVATFPESLPVAAAAQAVGAGVEAAAKGGGPADVVKDAVVEGGATYAGGRIVENALSPLLKYGGKALYAMGLKKPPVSAVTETAAGEAVPMTRLHVTESMAERGHLPITEQGIRSSVLAQAEAGREEARRLLADMLPRARTEAEREAILAAHERLTDLSPEALVKNPSLPSIVVSKALDDIGVEASAPVIDRLNRLKVTAGASSGAASTPGSLLTGGLGYALGGTPYAAASAIANTPSGRRAIGSILNDLGHALATNPQAVPALLAELRSLSQSGTGE